LLNRPLPTICLSNDANLFLEFTQRSTTHRVDKRLKLCVARAWYQKRKCCLSEWRSWHITVSPLLIFSRIVFNYFSPLIFIFSGLEKSPNIAYLWWIKLFLLDSLGQAVNHQVIQRRKNICNRNVWIAIEIVVRRLIVWTDVLFDQHSFCCFGHEYRSIFD